MEKIILDEINQKFGNCIALITGSYTNGNFNEFSDIDVVVGSPTIAISFNEKFHSAKLDRDIDCLVFPKLKISEEIIKSYNSRTGALIRMIHFGKVIKDENNILDEAKKLCTLYFEKGKSEEIDEHELRNKCIVISNSIEDLQDNTCKVERFFILNRLIDNISSLYLKLNNSWILDGKEQARVIKKLAPDFANDIKKISESFFKNDAVSENEIDILKKHLSRFKEFKHSHSTRNSHIPNNKELKIVLKDIIHSEFYLIQKKLSIEINKKYSFYITDLYFEYNDVKQQAFIKLYIDTSRGISTIDIYNNLIQDVFGQIKSSLSNDIEFNGLYGGSEMNQALNDYKKRISSILLQYLDSNNSTLEKTQAFNIGFYVLLFYFKNGFNKNKNIASYLYDNWLPNCYDIKALLSYEELELEKSKVENHFHLRYNQENNILREYISYFMESSSPPEDTGIINQLLPEITSLNSKIEFLHLYFFETDTRVITQYISEPISNINHYLAIYKCMDTLFNIIGVPAIDRSYIAYILKNYTNAE